MKVYDAREGGGFFKTIATPPCAASDECHGPSTQAPPPPPISTQTGSGHRNEIRGNSNCSRLGRRAKKHSHHAKALRRKARKANGRRAKALHRKAQRSAKQGSPAKQEGEGM